MLTHHDDAPFIRASFQRLVSLDTTVVCFGHGEPLTRAPLT